MILHIVLWVAVLVGLSASAILILKAYRERG